MHLHMDPQMKKDKKEEWILKLTQMSTTNSQFPSCDFTEVKFYNENQMMKSRQTSFSLAMQKQTSNMLKIHKDLLETGSAF